MASWGKPLRPLQRVYDFLPRCGRRVHAPRRATLASGLPQGSAYWCQDAIARNLSLEQTVAELKMPQFGSYALFDGVHPDLNVPAAYADLTSKP